MSEPGWENVTAPPTPQPPPPKPSRRPGRTTNSRRATSSPRGSARPTSRTAGTEPVEFTQQINAFLQGWLAGPLLGAGLAMRRRELIADASVIAEKGPPFAAETNNLAMTYPQVRQIVEKVTKMGPFGPLLQIVFEATVQIVTNHRQQLLPVTGQFFGARSLDDMVGPQEALELQIRELFTRADTSPNGSPPDAADTSV